mgnify:CR=1 FL=1
MMEYNIVLESFKGPLDLLLHLIEKAKVDIYDIPISEITDQYIDYLNKMKELDLEFLVMATTLLEIKSKTLLPGKDSIEKGEKSDKDEDPRVELVNRLIEYKKYKRIAEELKIKENVQNKVYYKLKEEFINTYEKDVDLGNLDVNKLINALNKVLSKKNKNIKPIEIDEIQREEVTLEECINKLKDVLKEEKKVSFSCLFDEYSTRSEVIGLFLSILELSKSKFIKLIQEENFSDIIIIKL